MLADLITRGAGNRDSRALSLALDNLGLDHDESVGQLHMRFWGATLARNIPAALEIYADILRRPHLPDEELEPVQALMLQDLQALEDEPKAEGDGRAAPAALAAPLGHDRRGTAEGHRKRSRRKQSAPTTRNRFGPRGTILSVAGNVEWEPLRDQVERLFGDWQGGRPSAAGAGAAAGRTHAPAQGHRRRRRSPSPIRACRSAIPITTPPRGRSRCSRAA